MATTLDNINLPSNPDLGAAEVGKDFLLFRFAFLSSQRLDE